MRTLRAFAILSIALPACGGGSRARDPSKELGRPFSMQCGAYELSVPSGGMISFNEEGDAIVEWKDRKAHFQIKSEARDAKGPPPIVIDESTVKPAPEGEPKPAPKPRDPNAERRIREKLFEKTLREQGCELKKDVRDEVTWYSCVILVKNARVRVITSVSEGDMCLAMCASLPSDPKATATCDAIAPAE